MNASVIPARSRRVRISRSCPLSRMSRADRCGTAVCPSSAMSSATPIVASMPCRGEAVTVIVTGSGRFSRTSCTMLPIGSTSIRVATAASLRANELAHVRLGLVLLRVDERLRDDDAPHPFLSSIDEEAPAGLKVVGGNHCVPDVLLQPGGEAGGGDLPDPLLAVVNTEDVDHRAVVEGTQRPAPDLDAGEPAGGALLLHSGEGVLADEVGAVEVDHPVVPHPDFERVGGEGDVAAVGEDPALDAPDVAGTGDAQPVRLARLEDHLPHGRGIPARVLHVYLIPHLRGISGAGYDDVDPTQVVLAQVVVRNG